MMLTKEEEQHYKEMNEYYTIINNKWKKQKKN